MRDKSKMKKKKQPYIRIWIPVMLAMRCMAKASVFRLTSSFKTKYSVTNAEPSESRHKKLKF